MKKFLMLIALGFLAQANLVKSAEVKSVSKEEIHSIQGNLYRNILEYKKSVNSISAVNFNGKEEFTFYERIAQEKNLYDKIKKEMVILKENYKSTSQQYYTLSEIETEIDRIQYKREIASMSLLQNHLTSKL